MGTVQLKRDDTR